MNVQNIAGAALAALALSACSWLHRGPAVEEPAQPNRLSGLFYDGKVCDKSPCRVEVTVEACRIQLDPDRLGVRHGLHDAEIVWEIVSPGYTFAPHGITFQDREMSKTVFREAGQAEPHRFVVVDANRGPGSYKYNVRVMKGEKKCPPLDPYIINDM
jgi:hypothetical protein